MSRIPKSYSQASGLYWCSAADHMEDCFVIATTRARAARFFADYNGYFRAEVSAKLVCRSPLEKFPDQHFSARLVDDEDLRAYGLKIVLDSYPRVIAIGDQMFKEGEIQMPPGVTPNMSKEPMSMEEIARIIEDVMARPSGSSRLRNRAERKA